jgi:pimeloyl-ACP methyl ester carboxylesterase
VRVAPTAAAAVLAFVLLSPPPANAALRFQRCDAFLLQCARLSVPLDRSGVTPGRVSLFVARLRARVRPARGAFFALAGGPGQAASDAFGGDGLGVLAPAFRRRDLIVFDQRGTGRSGVLRCRALERSNLFDAGPAAGACARRLGARRHHYTSPASVEDIEAIRRELGVGRITLYGTSYGVKVALGYALTYPANVERLVLDSVVEPAGPDPLYLPSLAAVPRVLGAVCRSRCRAFTGDPVADLGALVRRMAVRPLRGRVVDPRGRPRRVRLSRGELFLILLSGDFDPSLRAAFPGAVRAALDGDTAPLLRLKRRSISVAAEPPPPRVFSTALFTATTCEESPFPWPRTTPPDPFERRRLTEAAVASIPASAFLPFDRGAALENDLLQLCDRWAAAPAAPAFGPGPLPDVPVLLLEGEDDLRTPVESARRVAALFPRSKLVVVPDTGHSVLGSDRSGCARRAFARFFRGQAVPSRCPRRPRAFPALPPPPLTLREVPPAPGTRGIRGRALGALALTLRDVGSDSLTQLIFDPDDPDLARGGGLRAGRYRLGGNGTLRLTGVVFVPGVRVSGRLRRFGERGQRGSLRLSGPVTPDGALRVRGRRVVGRLGGQRVRTSLGARPAAASALSDARYVHPAMRGKRNARP